jgi:hypothetical protein
MRLKRNSCNSDERQSFELSENLPIKSNIFFHLWENCNWSLVVFPKFDEKSWNLWSLELICRKLPALIVIWHRKIWIRGNLLYIVISTLFVLHQDYNVMIVLRIFTLRHLHEFNFRWNDNIYYLAVPCNCSSIPSYYSVKFQHTL